MEQMVGLNIEIAECTNTYQLMKIIAYIAFDCLREQMIPLWMHLA